MDWRHKAACRTLDPELFFPIGNSRPALLQIERAKIICSSCPSIQPCLDWAMGHSQTEGVFGGQSEDERRALRRRTTRARVTA